MLVMADTLDVSKHPARRQHGLRTAYIRIASGSREGGAFVYVRQI